MLRISVDYGISLVKFYYGSKMVKGGKIMSRHGENIRKRKDGRWEGRYGIYEPRCGKKIVRSVYARTYEEVKEKLLSARICAESGLKGKMADTNIQFHTAAQEWLNTVEKKKKYATYIKYQSIYEKYIRENTAALTASDFGDIVPATLFREKERFQIGRASCRERV